MDADQPGLFELADGEPLSPTEKLQRGRNREVWALTATAEVTITNAGALTEAATLANEGFVFTGLEADLDVEDSKPEAPPAENGNDAFDALAWLIWPTQSLEGVLDIGAARILSVDSKVAADSDDRCTATWRVTVKLTDVDELRRLAAKAYPDESALISDGLAVALQRATDPYCGGTRPRAGTAMSADAAHARISALRDDPADRNVVRVRRWPCPSRRNQGNGHGVGARRCGRRDVESVRLRLVNRAAVRRRRASPRQGDREVRRGAC